MRTGSVALHAGTRCRHESHSRRPYDARVLSGPKNRFELADLWMVNGSMATRMPNKWWIGLLDGAPWSWRTAIDPSWKIVAASSGRRRAHSGRDKQPSSVFHRWP